MAKLRYNIIFPYRWLKEDRKFLKENIEKNFVRGKNQAAMHSMLLDAEPTVMVYGARIKQHAYQPKAYKMDKEEMTELLSDVFPGAKCVNFEKFFVQKMENSGLPVMELEIYY